MAGKISALIIPKLGLTMKEGKVAAWRVKPGGEVREGDPVADIETEKITSEYDSPASGILRRQVVSIGESLPIGTLIGVVAKAEVPDAEIESFISGYEPEQKS
jgi:pyruvate dehydrogenase E2 component (dihydrolipoamide acetyltransferase)